MQMKLFINLAISLVSYQLFGCSPELSMADTNKNVNDSAVHKMNYGTLSLPEIFSDNMVLQQQTRVAIWGKSQADKDVSVAPSWKDTIYRVKADNVGNWMIKMSTPKAGGPYRSLE